MIDSLLLNAITEPTVVEFSISGFSFEEYEQRRVFYYIIEYDGYPIFEN